MSGDRCTTCGTQLAIDTIYCPRCGEPGGPGESTTAEANWGLPPVTPAAGRRRGGRRAAFAIVALAAIVLAITGSLILVGAAGQPSSNGRYKGVFDQVGELPNFVEGILLSDGRCLLVGFDMHLLDRTAPETKQAWLFDPKSKRLEQVGDTSNGYVGLEAFATPDGGAILLSTSVQAAASETERFVPSSRSFIAGPALATRQTMASFVPLKDGSVAIVGGMDSDVVQVYDPRAGEFRDAGRLRETRWFAATAPLPDGRILAAGGLVLDSGSSDKRATAEIFDPRTGESTATGSLVMPRAWARAAPLKDGRVLVLVGTSSDDPASNRAEVYDPKIGRFTETGNTVQPHGALEAARLRDGRVLVVGRETAGNAEIYDPTSGSFSAAGTVPTMPMRDGAQLNILPLLFGLPDGRVLIISGKKLFIYS